MMPQNPEESHSIIPNIKAKQPRSVSKRKRCYGHQSSPRGFSNIATALAKTDSTYAPITALERAILLFLVPQIPKAEDLPHLPSKWHNHTLSPYAPKVGGGAIEDFRRGICIAKILQGSVPGLLEPAVTLGPSFLLSGLVASMALFENSFGYPQPKIVRCARLD
jgi:hypothetical protein